MNSIKEIKNKTPQRPSKLIEEIDDQITEDEQRDISKGDVVMRAVLVRYNDYVTKLRGKNGDTSRSEQESHNDLNCEAQGKEKDKLRAKQTIDPILKKDNNFDRKANNKKRDMLEIKRRMYCIVHLDKHFRISVNEQKDMRRAMRIIYKIEKRDGNEIIETMD